MDANQLFIERCHPVVGLLGTVPSTSTPAYISLKAHHRLAVIILVKNATTVTGSAITLKQATAVAGTGEKALAFDKMYANLDLGAGDTLTETAVTSNTFTTLTTDSKNAMYIIEVRPEMLDVNGGFDCIRAGTANATAATVTVLYALIDPRFPKLPQPTALTD